MKNGIIELGIENEKKCGDTFDLFLYFCVCLKRVK